jgi:hypothetical protein
MAGLIEFALITSVINEKGNKIDFLNIFKTLQQLSVLYRGKFVFEKMGYRPSRDKIRSSPPAPLHFVERGEKAEG